MQIMKLKRAKSNEPDASLGLLPESTMVDIYIRFYGFAIKEGGGALLKWRCYPASLLSLHSYESVSKIQWWIKEVRARNFTRNSSIAINWCISYLRKDHQKGRRTVLKDWRREAQLQAFS